MICTKFHCIGLLIILKKKNVNTCTCKISQCSFTISLLSPLGERWYPIQISFIYPNVPWVSGSREVENVKKLPKDRQTDRRRTTRFRNISHISYFHVNYLILIGWENMDKINTVDCWLMKLRQKVCKNIITVHIAWHSKKYRLR
jgi:hypothetical protein